MKTISRDGLIALLDTGQVTLVEALPQVHFDTEHIPGAINLSEPLTPERASEIASDRDAEIVTYCSGPGCTRSHSAANAFEKLGYSNVRVYTGGKTDWLDAGLPFTSTQAAA